MLSPRQLHWKWKLRQLHHKIVQRLTARKRAEQRYADLLVKYEHLAADRAVWIERAHGREAGWPLPDNYPGRDLRDVLTGQGMCSTCAEIAANEIQRARERLNDNSPR